MSSFNLTSTIFRTYAGCRELGALSSTYVKGTTSPLP